MLEEFFYAIFIYICSYMFSCLYCVSSTVGFTYTVYIIHHHRPLKVASFEGDYLQVSWRQDSCLSVAHEKSLMSSESFPQHGWWGGIFGRDGPSPALNQAGHALIKRLGRRSGECEPSGHQLDSVEMVTPITRSSP